MVLDQYDLEPGDDTYKFMERMVADSTVSHVLVVCDKEYADKANARRAGVGVESQIISKEIYEGVEQSKFIPIVTEFSSDGKAILPVFMSSRFWIDFSSNEKVRDSWESLIRVLYDRPRLVKPKLGAIPKYLDEDSVENNSVIREKLEVFRSAVKARNPDIANHRAGLIASCVEFADGMRVKVPLTISDQDLGSKVVNDCKQLVASRDGLLDWLLFDLGAGDQSVESATLTDVLEKLLELKARPEELGAWSDKWFGAHSVFVYESFLYIVAALIRFKRADLLRSIFEFSYLLPPTDRGAEDFGRFDRFWGRSEVLSVVLQTPDGRNYFSTEAELIKRQATRTDLSFNEIMEAELLVFLASLTDNVCQWYPGTLHYAEYSWVSPFFLRATRHSDFELLARIVRIENADELRTRVRERFDTMNSNLMGNFRMQGSPFWSMMNLKNLDTL